MSGIICPLCNKRLSTVTITEISDHGEVSHLPCCHHCVSQLNIQLQPIATSIAEIWARRDAAQQNADESDEDASPATHTQTLKQAFAGTEMAAAEKTERCCPDCGLTWEAFLKRNRFGCARDIEVFADLLNAPLQELHGTNQHLNPEAQDEHGLSSRQRLARLRAELAQAVAEEAFERAAELRDALQDAKDQATEKDQR